MIKPVHVGRRKPFHPTPWYLRIFNYLPYRRKERVRSLIIFDKEIWVYYDEAEKISLEIEEDERAKRYGWK